MEDSLAPLSCGHEAFDLHELADGLLHGAERRDVEDRVLSCGECRSALTAIQATIRAFQVAPLDAAPPLDITAAVMRSVRGEERKRWPVHGLAAALAALLIVAGVLLTWSPADTEVDADSSESLAPSLVVAISDPFLIGMEADAVVISGLTLALGASGFLLTRLLRPSLA